MAPTPPYEVQEHRGVGKVLKRNSYLFQEWPRIKAALAENPHPRQGSDTIVHLRANFYCSYRWRQGDYRFLYDIFEETKVVLIFNIGPRGQVYQKS